MRRYSGAGADRAAGYADFGDVMTETVGLFPLYHRYSIFSRPCGKVALYSTRKWHDGEICEARDARKVDGTIPEDGEIIVCGSCGADLSIHDVTYFANWEDFASHYNEEAR